jgi:rubrerythrin
MVEKKSIQGTRTEHNLMAAFAGESQARNRYTFSADAARKEGFEQIAAIFEETAGNERAHAERYFSFLERPVTITAEYPAPLGDLKACLESGIAGEHLENTVLYPGFAKVAKEEGFPLVATAFTEITEVEEQHEKRYRKLLKNLLEGKVFKKDTVVKWKCRNCGYVHEGASAPAICPACLYAQKYYELWTEPY